MAGFDDFAEPLTAAPQTPAATSAPQSTPQSANGWESIADPMVPPEKQAEKGDGSSVVFDPVSGISYNENDPSGPMRMAGGFAGAAGQYALAGPQLLAHAAKLVSPTYGGAAANAVDKAVDWLGKPGTDEYNIGKTAGTYSIPAMAWPFAADALTADAVPAITTTVQAMSKMAPTALRTISGIPAGILNSLGNVGSKAAASGLLSLFSRPVENAEDQGYWGPKGLQTAVDTALGSGALVDKVKPLVSGVGHWIKENPAMSFLGGGALEHQLGIGAIVNDLIHHPVLGPAALGALGLGGVLSTQAGQRFGAPIAGTAVQQMLPGILSGAGLQ